MNECRCPCKLVHQNTQRLDISHQQFGWTDAHKKLRLTANWLFSQVQALVLVNRLDTSTGGIT